MYAPPRLGYRVLLSGLCFSLVACGSGGTVQAGSSSSAAQTPTPTTQLPKTGRQPISSASESPSSDDTTFDTAVSVSLRILDLFDRLPPSSLHSAVEEVGGVLTTEDPIGSIPNRLKAPQLYMSRSWHLLPSGEETIAENDLAIAVTAPRGDGTVYRLECLFLYDEGSPLAHYEALTSALVRDALSDPKTYRLSRFAALLSANATPGNDASTLEFDKVTQSYTYSDKVGDPGVPATSAHRQKVHDDALQVITKVEDAFRK